MYDIADLYKAEVTIPIAFEVAAQAPDDLPAVVRRRVRDAMVEHHILEHMVHDIRYLLLNADEREQEPEAVYLWDNKVGNGINYFEEEGDGVVLTMTNCPPKLRGDLSKWLCEITRAFMGEQPRADAIIERVWS